MFLLIDKPHTVLFVFTWTISTTITRKILVEMDFKRNFNLEEEEEEEVYLCNNNSNTHK